MKNKIPFLLVPFCLVILIGCSSIPAAPSATHTLTPTSTNTPEPTATPTAVYTPTATAIPTLTADEVSACSQILFDALAESAESHYMDYPGLKFNNNHGGIGVMYYVISLADTKVVTIKGKQADVIKLLAVDVSPTDGKPVIRTYWQMFGYDKDDGTYVRLVSWGNAGMNVIDTDATLAQTGIADPISWVINRDALLQAYDSNYFFISSVAVSKDSSTSVYKMNPFRVIPENGKYDNNHLNSEVLNFGLDYEKNNGLIINNSFFAYKPYPEDWVNTIMEFYRIESVDDLKTTPVDKVRTCLDVFK